MGAIHWPKHPWSDLRSHYRAVLGRYAHERDLALAEAEKATRDLTETLPQALEAGVSVVDVAQLTGLSRPTIYRMLAGARKEHDVRKDLARLEHALETLDRSALPFDLASYLQISTDEVFDYLMRLYPLLRGELASFGPVGLTKLVELLPDLGVPERIVLAMLLLQDLPTERVAWSTKYSDVEVLGWASLGLLRILPRIREELHALPIMDSADAPVLTSSRQLWRYPIGDPRQHADCR